VIDVPSTLEQPAVDPGKHATVEIHHDLTCLHVDTEQLVARACVI
jgi:hypothetical protein